MNRHVIPVGPIDANCVVLWNEPSAAWIVDPGADADAIIGYCERHSLVPALIAFTHGHFDHIGAMPDLLAKWPELKVHISPADVQVAFSPLNCWEPYYHAMKRPATLVEDLVEGATLEAGGLAAKIVSVPGHTPGGVAFYFEQEKFMLTGDTLFAGSCGRTDFPGGSSVQLSASLRRLMQFPGEVAVLPGHGGPTTIAHEAETNPYVGS